LAFRDFAWSGGWRHVLPPPFEMLGSPLVGFADFQGWGALGEMDQNPP